MSRVPSVLTILSLFLCVVPERSAADDAPLMPARLIERYDAFIDSLRTLKFHSRGVYQKQNGDDADWKWTAAFETQFARKSDRWRVRKHEVGFNEFDGRKIPFDLVGENTYDGKSSLIVNQDHQKIRELTTMDEETANQYLAGHDAGPAETDVSAEIDAAQSTAANDYATQNETNFLHGYLPFDQKFVSEVLRDGLKGLKTRREQIEGRDAVVVTGPTPYGVITLWLDPANHYGPIKLHQLKSENDLMGQTRLGSLKAQGKSKDGKPNPPLRGVEYSVSYKLANEDGQALIIGYDRIDRMRYEGGSRSARRIQGTLSKISLAPEPADLEPTLPIPEETRVFVRNRPEVPAKWSGRKLVVLNGDTPTVATLDANWVSEQDSVWTRYQSVILIALAALAVVVVALAFTRFRRGR